MWGHSRFNLNIQINTSTRSWKNRSLRSVVTHRTHRYTLTDDTKQHNRRNTEGAFSWWLRGWTGCSVWRGRGGILWPHQCGTCYWSTGHFGLYRDACIDRHGLCRHRGVKRGRSWAMSCVPGNTRRGMVRKERGVFLGWMLWRMFC